MQKWSWFRRYCSAVRVAQSIINRTPLPPKFCAEVRKKIMEMNPPTPIPTAMETSMQSSASNNSSNAQISSNSAPPCLNVTSQQINESMHSISSNEGKTKFKFLFEFIQTLIFI